MQAAKRNDEAKRNALRKNATNEAKRGILRQNVTNEAKRSVLRQNTLNEAKRNVLRQNATNEAKRSVLRQNTMNEAKRNVLRQNATNEAKRNIQRISLTGFPAQSVGSSNTDVLDSPCLLVLIIGTSQSRQHASSTTFLQRVISSLHAEFSMTDLGSLNYFLGISAQQTSAGMFLSQSKYAEEILERAHMQHCNPCRTSVDTESKLGPDGDLVSDSTLYRSLASAL
ncbi:ribonuclease H-like domain-containing protein [Tanacetum coccineum]